MREKIKKIRLWYINGLNIDEVIEKHIELVTNPTLELINQDEFVTCDTASSIAEPQYIITKDGKSKPSKSILYHKYLYLIHLIIVKCQNDRNNCIHLNYQVIKSVLGKDIGSMLYTLKAMGVIYLSNYYEVGKSSRVISLLKWNISHKDIPNQKVIKYSEDIKAILGEGTKTCVSNYSEEFIANYNFSLSMLELNSRNEAFAYINSINYKSEHSYWFHWSKINRFKENPLTITSFDSNNRIYHYLTNLPKSLKKFFNIKFQIDISNSHPLLFSYYLINKYNIKYDLLNSLLSIDKYNDDYNIRYEGIYLRKSLRNKGINVPTVKDLPHDVLVYIYRTEKGYFWDDFIELFGDYSRGEVKAMLFREVFYSYGTTMKGKTFGKLFAERYPNVWKTIRSMKQRRDTKLPNTMMKLESELFYKILKKCYSKGWKAINIHDAVVVLDVHENAICTPALIENIIKEVYIEYQIIPSVSTEFISLNGFHDGKNDSPIIAPFAPRVWSNSLIHKN